MEAALGKGLSGVFGYPGDGLGGRDVALEKAKDYMHYVQVRHEEMPAFMASAHAKFVGEVGLPPNDLQLLDYEDFPKVVSG
jgi:thiamine pyrophosphate-dependent acetolactate synthase large subunit-like protein